MIGMPSSAPWGFNRSSIVDQAAAALRDAIRRGELREPLPGGHQLARRLGISRPSIQAALGRLASEGVLVVRKGHRCRLATPPAAPAASQPPAVCVIYPVSPDSTFFLEHPLLLEMHAEFASRGIGWEVLSDPKLGTERPQKRLKQLVEARPHACWILFSTLEPLQAWFAAADVPAVVLGSCPADIALPSADINYEAVGWHAAGEVVRHGHTNVALILPPEPLPGDRASRRGFLRYMERRTPAPTVTDWNIPDQVAPRRAKLERLLSGGSRPTVLVSLRPALTIAVVAAVLAAGLRIPQDVSIISRDTHPLLDAALPDLTRYRSTYKQLAMRAVRIAARVLAGRAVPARPSLVTPTFVPGGTLAQRPPAVRAPA